MLGSGLTIMKSVEFITPYAPVTLNFSNTTSFGLSIAPNAALSLPSNLSVNLLRTGPVYGIFQETAPHAGALTLTTLASDIRVESQSGGFATGVFGHNAVSIDTVTGDSFIDVIANGSSGLSVGIRAGEFLKDVNGNPQPSEYDGTVTIANTFDGDIRVVTTAIAGGSEGAGIAAENDISIGSVGSNASLDVHSDGSAIGIGSYRGDVQVTGDFAGTVSAISDQDESHGVFARQNVTIGGELSATITSRSGGDDYSTGIWGLDSVRIGSVGSNASIAVNATLLGHETYTGIMSGVFNLDENGYHENSPYAGVTTIGQFDGDVTVNAPGGTAIGIMGEKELTVAGFGSSANVSVTGSNLAVALGSFGEVTIGSKPEAALLAAAVPPAGTGTLSGTFEATATNGHAYAIASQNGVTITGSIVDATLRATSGKGEAAGINTEGNVTIGGELGGTIEATATGSDALHPDVEFNAYGIYAYNNISTGSVSGKITATAVQGEVAAIKGEKADLVKIDGDMSGEVTTHTASGTAFGIESDNDLWITGNVSGKVTVSTDNGDAVGLVGQNNLTIGGSVTSSAMIDVTGSLFAVGLGVADGNLDIAGDLGGTLKAASSGGDAFGAGSASGDMHIASYSAETTITSNTVGVGLGAGLDMISVGVMSVPSGTPEIVPAMALPSGGNLFISGAMNGKIEVSSTEAEGEITSLVAAPNRASIGIYGVNSVRIGSVGSDTEIIAKTEDGSGYAAGIMSGLPYQTVPSSFVGSVTLDNAFAGKIEASADGGEFGVASAVGVFAEKQVSIGSLDGSITATASGANGDAYGIIADFGSVTIGNISGTVTATANGADQGAVGIHSGNGDLTVDAMTGTASITATSTKNAAALDAGEGSVVVRGGLAGTISATASAAGSYGYGIYADQNVSIGGELGGTVEATTSMGNACGIIADNIYIAGPVSATISAETTGSDALHPDVEFNAYGIYAYDNITTGSVSGKITATSVQGEVAAIKGEKADLVKIDGDMSGEVTTHTESGTAFGIESDKDLSITGNVSGKVTVSTDNGDAVGLVGQNNLTIGGSVTSSSMIDVTGSSSFVVGLGAAEGDLEITGDLGGTLRAASSGGEAFGAATGIGNFHIASYSAETTITSNTTGIGVGAGLDNMTDLDLLTAAPLASDPGNLLIDGDISGKMTVTSENGFAFGYAAYNTLTVGGGVSDAATIDITVNNESAPDDGAGIVSIGNLWIKNDMAGAVTVHANEGGGIGSDFGSVRLGELSGSIDVDAGQLAVGLKAETSLTIDGDLSGSIHSEASKSSAHGIRSIVGDVTLGGISGSIEAVATGNGGKAYGIIAQEGSMSIGGISATGKVSAEAEATGGVAAGIVSNGDIALSDLSGTVSATGENALGIGSMTGSVSGASGAPMTISGKVSATGVNNAAAIVGYGAMNLSISGEVSATTSAAGLDYAILSAAFNPLTGEMESSQAVSDTVLITATGAVTGDVDLGAGDDSMSVAGAMDGDIFLGDGKDTLTLSKATAGFLYGGTGAEDKLVLTGAGDSTLDTRIVREFESLQKEGTGTWVLTETLTPTVASASAPGEISVTSAPPAGWSEVSVNAGTLQVDGALESATATVADGATLSGSGSLAGTTTFEADATLMPGSDGIVGALAFENLTMEDGSSMQFDLFGAGNYDQIAVDGTLTLDGTVTLHVAKDSVTGDYDIITYGDIAGGAENLVLDGTADGVFTANAGTVNLQLTNTGQIMQYWNGAAGGSGTWNSTDTNWSGSDGSNQASWAGQVGIFKGVAGTVTVAGVQNIEGLQFKTDGYVLTGGTLDLTGDSGRGTDASYINVDTGVTATVGSMITGEGIELQKLGTGTLVLNGANTYTGGTLLSSGILSVGNNSALGTGTLTMENNTMLFAGADALTVGNAVTLGGAATLDTGANAFTLSGAIDGEGSLSKSGAGTLVLTGVNSYTGGTAVTAGTLQGNTASLQGDITNNAVVVFDQATAGAYAGAMSGSGSVTKQGAGTLTLTDANSYSGGTTVSEGKLSVGNNSSLGTGSLTMGNNTTLSAGVDGLTVGNAVTLDGGATVDTATNAFMLSGAIGGTGSLTKSGSGALALTGANSYTGGTTVSEGKLSVGNNSSLGTGSLTMGNNTTLATGVEGLTVGNAVTLGGATTVMSFQNNFTLSGEISGVGSLTKGGSGTLTLAGANSYSGGTTVAEGTLHGNTASLQSDIANNASVVFDQATAGAYAGVMSGTGSVTKRGAGMLTFNGNLTQTNLNVNDGGVTNNAAMTLSGALALGDAASLVNGAAGTMAVTGGITGTDGIQTLDNAGIINAASIALGGGNDAIRNSGTIAATTVDMGAGDDTMTVTGHAVIFGIGTLDGGAGTDALVFDNWTGKVEDGEGYLGTTVVNWENISLINDSVVHLGPAKKLVCDQLTIEAGSILDGHGYSPVNYTIIGNVVNNGTISLLDPAGSSGGDDDTMLITGDYSGNGVVKLDVSLGTAHADTITINGSASGQTSLVLNEVNNNGLVDGTTLTLITVGGADTMTFGSSEYLYGSNVYTVDLTNLGSGLFSLNNFQLAGLQEPVAVMQGVIPFIERLGNESVSRFHERSRGGSDWWVRSYGSHYNLDLSGEAGTELKGYTSGLQVGVDLLASKGKSGGSFEAGVFAGTGYSKSEVSGFRVTKAGELTDYACSLGLYADLKAGERFWADAVVQGTWHDLEMTLSDRGQNIDQNFWGALASVEAGYTFPVSDAFSLTPEAQFVWQHTGRMTMNTDIGAVSLNSHDGVMGRIGVVAQTGSAEDRSHLFAQFDAIKDFSDSVSVDYKRNDNTLSSSPEKTFVGGALGVRREAGKDGAGLGYFVKAGIMAGVDGGGSNSINFSAGLTKTF